MPNWCENELSVSGSEEELKRFREFANPLSAEKFLPTPDELKGINPSAPCGGTVKTTESGQVVVSFAGVDIWERPRCRTVDEQNIPLSEEEQKVLFEKYGARDWYEWRVKNWKTKWDFCHCEVEDRSEMVVYRFNTAWSPPIPVIDKMGEMYPSLSFLFSFRGDESLGAILYVEGEWKHSKYIYFSQDCSYYEQNFSQSFFDSLCKAFPGMYIGPRRVANE